ncbi:hypothetical protein [Crocosphaera sp. XPORK-15E]|nr:hypothetical protein [Crocosphaera sp. XPORK-15E]
MGSWLQLSRIYYLSLFLYKMLQKSRGIYIKKHYKNSTKKGDRSDRLKA